MQMLERREKSVAARGYIFPCALTTGKGLQSRIRSWDKTFFLTPPWNWIRPQMLQTQPDDSMSDCHFCRIPASDGDSSGKDLHGYADDELGHVGGLPELYAKTQKVHAELVTKGKTKKKEIKFNLSLTLCTFDKKQRCGDDSLLLRGEDFKGASREHLIEHVEKGNGHPRGGQIQGHARHLTFSLILNVVL